VDNLPGHAYSTGCIYSAAYPLYIGCNLQYITRSNPTAFYCEAIAILSPSL